jgi:hypothetical protein
MEAKQEAVDALCGQGIDASIERRVGDGIADVFFVIGDSQVAIEFQKSSIPCKAIWRRTENYTSHGVSVAWVVLEDDAYYIHKKQSHTLRPFERWLCSINHGEIHFWDRGGKILTLGMSGDGRAVSPSLVGYHSLVEDFRTVSQWHQGQRFLLFSRYKERPRKFIIPD